MLSSDAVLKMSGIEFKELSLCKVHHPNQFKMAFIKFGLAQLLFILGSAVNDGCEPALIQMLNLT